MLIPVIRKHHGCFAKVAAMGEDGPGSKMWNAFCSMCVGMVVFPLSLYLLGSNEQQYMCTHKSIIFADQKSKVIQCDQPDLADGIAFMSCPIKEESLMTFNGVSFGASGIGNAIHFKSAAAAMKAEMFQCVEYSKEEKIGNTSVKVYSYKMEWKDSLIDVYKFSWTAQAITARDYGCPGLTPGQGGHIWPSNVPRGTVQHYAPEVRAGPLIIDSELMRGGYASGLSINFATPVNLNEFRGSFEGFDQLPMTKLVQSMIQPAAHHASNWYTQVVKNPVFTNAGAGGPASHPGPGHHPAPHHGRRLFDFTNPFGHTVKTMDMSSVGPHNAAIDGSGTYVITCQQQRIGCIRIQFFKNWDTIVTMVSAVQGGSTLPVDVPSSWGCGTDKFQALEGGKESKSSFFSMMEESNTSTTWMMRVFGLLLTWAAVYCCFAPIAGAIDVVGDCIRGIPCLGQFLEDLLEGMVTCILCVVSCGFGCSCGLFVIAVVWLYMRPLIGGGLMLFCAALAAGAYFLGQGSKNKDSRNLVSELVPMTEGNNPA